MECTVKGVKIQRLDTTVYVGAVTWLAADDPLRKSFVRNMPKEFRHLATEQRFPRLTEEEMIVLAELAREAKVDLQNGFLGYTPLLQLAYFRLSRCVRLDRFHLMMNIIKEIFKFIRNKKSAEVFNNKRRRYCSKHQRKLRYLMPTESLDNEGKVRENKKGEPIMESQPPDWAVSEQVRKEVDDLSQKLKFSVGCGSKLKRIFSQLSQYKGHDAQLLAGDAGVYLILHCKLGKKSQYLLCSLIRIVEEQCLKSIPVDQLPKMFERTVRVLAECEQHFPIYTNTLVRHSLIHNFAFLGYLHDLGPSMSTWMYGEERFGGVLKHYVKSGKNPYESASRVYSTRSACEYLKAANEGMYTSAKYYSQMPTEGEANLLPDYLKEEVYIKWGGTGYEASLSPDEKTKFRRYLYYNCDAEIHPEYVAVRRRYDANVRPSNRKNNPIWNWVCDFKGLSDTDRAVIVNDCLDTVTEYKRVLVNGTLYRSQKWEKHLSTMNCGVKAGFDDGEGGKTWYYGIILRLVSIVPYPGGQPFFMAYVEWLVIPKPKKQDKQDKKKKGKKSKARPRPADSLIIVNRVGVSQSLHEPWVELERIVIGNVCYFPWGDDPTKLAVIDRTYIKHFK